MPPDSDLRFSCPPDPNALLLGYDDVSESIVTNTEFESLGAVSGSSSSFQA